MCGVLGFSNFWFLVVHFFIFRIFTFITITQTLLVLQHWDTSYFTAVNLAVLLMKLKDQKIFFFNILPIIEKIQKWIPKNKKICLSIYQSINQSINQSIYLTIYLSIYHQVAREVCEQVPKNVCNQAYFYNKIVITH